MIPINQIQDPSVVNLLWTGGWDSTFRLLQLVIEKEVTVRPIYIIHTDRASTSTEIQTIDKIKKLTHELFSQTVGRILPTSFFSFHDIKPYPEITEKFTSLRQKSHLGSQYDWLARFAKQHNVNDLELSIHLDDKAHAFIKDVVEKGEDQNGETYHLAPGIESSDPLSLFKPFKFPLLEWSKVMMKEYSHEKGTIDIMNNTWFCYKPQHGEPCGLCNPCKYSIEEGMKYRFPKKALWRYQVNRNPITSKVRFLRTVALQLLR